MAIIENFDFDALRKARARKASTGGMSLVDGLNQISPDIAKLKVGQTAKIEIPGGKNNLRKTVMGITAKLNNLTPRGEEWEGRQYLVRSDGEEYVYVMRDTDLTGDDIREPRKTGGGRPRKNRANALEASRKHLGGDTSADADEGKGEATDTPTEAAEAVVKKGKKVTAKDGVLIEEHA